MKTPIYITGSLLLAAIIYAVYITLPVSDAGIQMMGVLGFVQLFYSLFCWYKVTRLALSPYIVFLVAAYVFTYGQSFLSIIGKVNPEYDLTDLFLPSSIMPAQLVTLMFLNFFHIGAMLSNKGNRRRINLTMQSYERYRYNQVRGIRKVGKLFLWISVIPYIVDRISVLLVVLSYGYTGIYMQEEKIGIFNIVNILSQYFIPGVLCLLLVETSKSRRRLYVFLLVFEMCFWLYTGGRSNGVIIAAILLMYYHICVKPIRFNQAVIVAVAGFFFVSLLGVIAETRSDSDADLSEAISKGFGDSNAFYAAVSEMGFSQYPMTATMELIPEMYDYRYGSSYFYALTSVIPNLGFWDLHPAMKYGNMNAWLQNAMNLNFGPGYSIVAEAYANFGNFGFLVMLLLGYCYGLIFNVNERNRKNPLLLVLSFIFCFLVIKTVRNSFLATVRSLFYYILPIYLIVVYYYKGKLIK